MHSRGIDLAGIGPIADRDRRHGGPFRAVPGPAGVPGAGARADRRSPAGTADETGGGFGDPRGFAALDSSTSANSSGYFIDAPGVSARPVPDPARELEEMLPQQSLVLKVAAEAIADAGWDERPRSTGVLIGIGLDLNTTNFHLRWSLDGQGPEMEANARAGISDEELAGGPMRCRIRRARRCRPTGRWVRWAAWSPAGSPASSGSAGRASRSRARRPRASRLWRSPSIGWTRRARRGDRRRGRLAGDLRTFLARRARGSSRPHCQGRKRGSDVLGVLGAPEASDGARCGLVLKRLEDARRDGDRVHAVLARLPTEAGRVPNGRATALQPGYVDVHSACPLAPAHDRRFGRLIQTFSQGQCSPSFAIGSIAGDLGELRRGLWSGGGGQGDALPRRTHYSRTQGVPPSAWSIGGDSRLSLSAGERNLC